MDAESPRNPTRGRLVLVGVLTALVFARGLALLCIMPPFEAPDEYQHVGYVVHLAQGGDRPEPGRTEVPPPLIEKLGEFPQSRSPAVPRGKSGVSAYAAFWGGARAARMGANPPRDPMYQAQHGPTYYRIATPLFRMTGGLQELRASVAALRFANLLLTTAAVGLALGFVGRLVTDTRTFVVASLLIATQPLFLTNGVRVANDALGVLLATGAIVCGVGLERRRFLAACAGLGALVGAAVLAKSTNLGLLPFAAFVWGAAVVECRVPLRRAMLGGVVVAGAFVLVAGIELKGNLERYGAISPMQEAIVNRNAGRTGADLLRTARAIDWPDRIGRLWLHDNLAVGGWSFLRPLPKAFRAYGQAAGFGLLGLACVPFVRRRPTSSRLLFGSAIVCAGYTLGLAYHMVQSRLAWGESSTGPWYAAPAYPWFLLLVAVGACAWPLGRYRGLPGLALVVFQMQAEAAVVWGRMIVVYSGGASGLLSLERLAWLQPKALGTATLVASVAAVLVLAALGFVLGADTAIGHAGIDGVVPRPKYLDGTRTRDHKLADGHGDGEHAA